MPVRLAGWMYLHPPKTGGTTATSVLLALGGTSVGSQHAPAWQYEDRRLPGERWFGSVRHPLPWYVSWYEHCRYLGGYERTLEEYGDGRGDFRSVLYGATHTNARQCPHNPVICNETEPDGRPVFLRLGVGLATFSVLHTLADRRTWREGRGVWLADALVSTSQLYAGMSTLLGESITEERYPRRNVRAAAADWRTRYDDEMIAWVRHADRFLLDLMRYDEPEPPAVVWPGSRCEVR